MKYLLATFLLLTLATPRAAGAGGIVVNEYSNGTGPTSGATKMTNSEYIEFALTQNMTSTALAALTFGDSNNSTSTLQGVFHFDKTTLDGILTSAGRADFLPGTIIVVKGTGLGAQNLTYNPLSTNTSTSDLWSIELVAGQGALDHPETLINNDISITTGGDVVWISTGNPPANSTDTSGFIDALGHDPNPGFIANQVISKFGASHMLAANLNNGSVLLNTGDATVVLTQSATGSMAAPNSAANATWMTTLRDSGFIIVPEPSRMVYILAGVAACLLRRKRPTLPAS